MPNAFKIIPTPPITVEVEPGKDGVFSFTVESFSAPEKVIEIIPKAFLVDAEGRGKEVDWLVAGPRPELSISGGETTTITITAKPRLASPSGEHKVKLVIAEKGRPNDVYAESAPVFCKVVQRGEPADDRKPRKRWWLIPVIAGGILVLGGGGVLAWWFLQPPPVAVASAEPLSGHVPMTVNFQSKSTGKVSKIAWDFGDGSPISEDSDPDHTYQQPATYTVELTVSDKRGRSSTAQLTVKADPPVLLPAAAAGEPLAGPVPLTVKFQNRSASRSSKAAWNFGDGSPVSEDNNPIHTYQTPGTYTVTLTIKDSYGGSSTAQLTVTAVRPEGPVAAASGTPLTGRIPLIVRFQNLSTGNPTSLQWSFGDGSPISTEANPIHTYQRPGSYTVTLTARDRYGASSTAQLAVKADPPPPPVAAASGTPLTGRVPLIVRFQNRSTGNPTSLQWSFGDGSPISTEANPTHTYQRPGSYTVTLTAKDSYDGSSTARLTVTAEPPPPPVARFQPSATSGKWPLDVLFTNTSQNLIAGTRWAWTFGDGATSSEQSPRHRFENPGDHKVRLRVSNANGSSETEATIRVLSRRGEPVAQRVGPFGGAWGTWAGQFQKCPGTSLAYGFEDKTEPSQGGGDDTALNGIKLWCVNLPDLQSNNYITSNQGQWGNWSERMDCRDRKSHLVGARLRIEPPQGSGDDTGGVDVEFSCANGSVLSNGGHGWGAWKDWSYCPAQTAICGIRTRIEPSQGGGDDTALNDVELQCCYIK